LGIAAAACHHALLTLPAVVEGHQQTAQMMKDDVIKERLPIADGPLWGTPEGSGLGVEVDVEKLGCYHECYLRHGQFLPYDKEAQ
jgi:L-alanine-DL-glutamate epimerase-like enolase superfamily enzyme